MPYNVVLALGKVRLLLSRKLYGTSFSSNTCVMKVGLIWIAKIELADMISANLVLVVNALCSVLIIASI